MIETVLAAVIVVMAAVAVRLQHLEIQKERRRAHRAADRLADERIKRQIAEARVAQLLDELDAQVDALVAGAAARHPAGRTLHAVKGPR